MQDGLCEIDDFLLLLLRMILSDDVLSFFHDDSLSDGIYTQRLAFGVVSYA